MDQQIASLTDSLVRRHAAAAYRYTELAARCRRLGWLDDARAYMSLARREYYRADRARFERMAATQGFQIVGGV